MTYHATILGCLFLALALALAGCEVLGVYEYVTEHKSSYYIVIGSSIIAAVTPGLPAMADWFWRGRRRLSCIAAWLAFAVCLVIVLTAAIQRTGSATDAGEQGRISAERAERLAVRAEKQATDDYAVAQAAAIRECDVRAKKCMDAEAKAEVARAALALARKALVAAPAGEQADPLARRIAAVLRFMPEDQIRLLWPLLVPVALSILSALFFAGWSRLDFVEHASPAPTPIARPALVAKKIAPTKVGGLAAFMVSATEPLVGASIEIERTLFQAYQAWCSSVGVIAMPPSQFARDLAQVGQAAGITIEIRGKQAYCLDRRLAA